MGVAGGGEDEGMVGGDSSGWVAFATLWLLRLAGKVR